MIGASGFENEASASEWLERCRKDERAREQATEAALLVVNRALHGHRIAGADPYAREVSSTQAQTVRLGYGTGDELVDGYWKAAYTLPAGPSSSRSRRRRMLAPQEELAGILSGRRPARPSEDLVLRARLDLDQRRPEQAALQLGAAVDALEAELRGTSGSNEDAESAAALRACSASVRELAGAAAGAALDEGQVLALTDALEQLERALRRRRLGHQRQ